MCGIGTITGSPDKRLWRNIFPPDRQSARFLGPKRRKPL